MIGGEHSDYLVDLDTFRGPLDLLLYLVKRDEVDIRDIPIARLVEQFKEYLNVLELIDVERAGDLPHALRRRRQPLALDITLIPYHGKPLHHADEIYRSQAKSGTSHFHAYATAYVIRKGRRFTVALTSVGRHDAMPDVLKRLLRQAARAGVRPRYVLLDRGFCSVDVIRYLQQARYAWLMPLVLRGRKADHPKGPSGSRVFARCKRSGWRQYTMTSSTKRQARFQVCITCRNRRGVRGRHGREALVYAFGGPLSPSSYAWVKET